MKGNGLKIGVVLAFVVLSLWYLFPTLQNYLKTQELNAMTEDARETYRENNYNELVSLRERTLNLGLDLQGGMHVTLEVGAGALLTELAADRADEDFAQAIQTANERALTEDGSYVSLFTEALEEVRPDARLSRYFRNTAAGITLRSENSAVVEYLEQEVDDALGRAVEIIRQRVDRFGVTEPSIQRQGSSRIVVELPGIDDPQRVRDLLRGTAELTFHLTANSQELQQVQQRLVNYFQSGETAADSAVTDTSAADTSEAEADSAEVLDVGALAGQTPDTGADDPGAGTQRSFLEMVQLAQPGVNAPQGTPEFGYVAESDTAAVGEILRRPKVQEVIPSDIRLLYASRPRTTAEGGDGEAVYPLVTVKAREELGGDVITDAQPTFDPLTNAPLVSLSMDSDGARRWSQITGANIGEEVAIVMDDLVFTYPTIQSRIAQGRTQIEGVGRGEAEDIVTVLKSGALPAPVEIIEERTVGPSLGAQSVRQGSLSLLIGFVLVAVFMAFYYRGAGLMADVALILNVLFIFGILAAFGATLTLPGMAGIVLTIGMAVDANVLIFERIREEQEAGKTMKAAVEGGFAKALSAIADANITTFLIAVILYSFGVGPIQGFAVTLMAGILTSLFSALVITRLLMDFFVVERGVTLSMG